jgi:hypothetical protein
MCDAAAQSRAMVSHQGNEILVGIAFVQKHGLAHVDRELQLTFERGELIGTRREISEVVQSAFTHCDDVCMLSELSQLAERVLIQIGRVMGMNPRGTTEQIVMGRDEIERAARARDGAAGNQHAHDADLPCAFDDFGTIAIEAVVSEVDADVDQ